MRNLTVNPLVYSDYSNNSIYEGERVYHIFFGSVDDAYAIREDGEDYEDFVGEIDSSLRRRYGRRVNIRMVEDVTGILCEEDVEG